MKDSFVLYTKYGKQMKALTMEQRGILFTAIFAYESGEDMPEMDASVSMAFDFIRTDLDENREKYEETCRKNAESGRKGGLAKQANASERKQALANASERERGVANLADNDNDNDLKEKESPKGDKKKNFVKPTVDEVSAYCIERGNNVDPDQFVNFYESKGWKVGNAPMKDWKAAVRTWEKRREPGKVQPIKKGYSERTYDYDQIEKDLFARQMTEVI